MKLLKNVLSALLILITFAWMAQDMGIAERVSPVERWLMSLGLTDLQTIVVEFGTLGLLTFINFLLVRGGALNNAGWWIAIGAIIAFVGVQFPSRLMLWEGLILLAFTVYSVVSDDVRRRRLQNK